MLLEEEKERKTREKPRGPSLLPKIRGRGEIGWWEINTDCEIGERERVGKGELREPTRQARHSLGKKKTREQNKNPKCEVQVEDLHQETDE